MASRAIEPAALDFMLCAIPSLSRPVLARLTARLINYLDEIDRDPDIEEDDPFRDERKRRACLSGRMAERIGRTQVSGPAEHAPPANRLLNVPTW
jgi:hypothetical protein